MLITDADFNKMVIKPITKDTDQKIIFEHLPAFINFKGYYDHRIKIINYILLMFDVNSPFIKNFQDITKRKREVISYVGLSRVKKETVDEITNNKNPEVLLMIDEFVKYINSRLWSLIVTHETAFFEYQSEILLVIDEDGSKDKLTALNLKTKILSALDDMSTKLDGYYFTLYSGDDDLETAIKNISISPESIALDLDA